MKSPLPDIPDINIRSEFEEFFKKRQEEIDKAKEITEYFKKEFGLNVKVIRCFKKGK